MTCLKNLDIPGDVALLQHELLRCKGYGVIQSTPQICTTTAVGRVRPSRWAARSFCGVSGLVLQFSHRDLAKCLWNVIEKCFFRTADSELTIGLS